VFKIFLEGRAEKDLDDLENFIRERIVKAILKLRTDSRTNAKKLQGSKNAWRIRIGNWRVIYEINDKKKEIKIYRVKHRSKAYF
jgi:mRNA interferase RelE/StbE